MRTEFANLAAQKAGIGAIWRDGTAPEGFQNETNYFFHTGPNELLTEDNFDPSRATFAVDTVERYGMQIKSLEVPDGFLGLGIACEPYGIWFGETALLDTDHILGWSDLPAFDGVKFVDDSTLEARILAAVGEGGGGGPVTSSGEVSRTGYWEITRNRSTSLLLCTVAAATATDYTAVHFSLIPQEQYGGPIDEVYTFNGTATQIDEDVELRCALTASQSSSLFVLPDAGFERRHWAHVCYRLRRRRLQHCCSV
jgi:hypothetical protein